MIIINNFSISSDRESFNISVETSSPKTITNIEIWSDSNFKDYSKSSSLVDILTNSNTENLNVNSSFINECTLDGIYFIEVTDSTNEKVLAIAANLSLYENFKLSKILELKKCSGVVFDDNICNDSNANTIINIDTLLDAICTSIKLGFLEEAISILNSLRKLYDSYVKCKSCKILETPILKTGLNFSTLNNSLILG